MTGRVTVRLHPAAVAEAEAAATWYDGQIRGLGDEFLAEVTRALEKIADSPTRWARVAATSRVRRALLARFPYAVFYEVTADRTYVIAIAHASRRPRYWKRRTGG